MRPIWNGTISFGLLNIPISLMPGEREMDLRFRLLDNRNQSPIRYERVNAETGNEVPWKDVVKAFEFDKGNYVVMADSDFKEAAPAGRETVELSTFVDEAAIDSRYFERPYVVVPAKKAEKGYVLLRETLRKLKMVGVARVVIRTREYLCIVKPLENALVLILLRFPQEVVQLSEYELPSRAITSHRISKAEVEMATQLIKNMAGEWDPEQYKDEFRARLKKVIERRLREKGKTAKVKSPEAEAPEGSATNVVDFMALLKRSVETRKRTPATSAPQPEAKARAAKSTARTRPRARKSASAKTPRQRSSRASA